MGEKNLKKKKVHFSWSHKKKIGKKKIRKKFQKRKSLNENGTFVFS